MKIQFVFATVPIQSWVLRTFGQNTIDCVYFIQNFNALESKSPNFYPAYNLLLIQNSDDLEASDVSDVELLSMPDV